MHTSFYVDGQFVDLAKRTSYPARVIVLDGRIQDILHLPQAPSSYILPGFTDAHIHIESSMLTPAAFSRVATVYGTVATVSDPHEIANVCGVAGVQYMIDNARNAALKFNFGAPSCVPATGFETAGAVINSDQIKDLLAMQEIRYLAEMMNFPGVLHEDEEVMKKISWAKYYGKPVDGHAPQMKEEDVVRYAAAGIGTDHECTTLEEALYKIRHGMKILIREGSAARNFEALVPLFATHPGQVMFCSDDKHPDELVRGHINQLVVRAVAKGYDVYDVLHAACVAPVQHYKLDVGLLRPGDPADFIVVEDLTEFTVLQTYIDGQLVVSDGINYEQITVPDRINNFNCLPVDASAFEIAAEEEGGQTVQVIEALDGQLITNVGTAALPVVENLVCSDVRQDVLKIVVVNRYAPAPPAIGFIRNFGLKAGAIASTVAHDSHNIVAVGVNDEAIAEVVNALIEVQGGIAVTGGDQTEVMPLPIAGLITDMQAGAAAAAYEKLNGAAKDLGCSLSAPFMTLSFMALPVIPSLKMTDKGLFNVDSFNFTSVLESKQL